MCTYIYIYIHTHIHVYTYIDPLGLTLNPIFQGVDLDVVHGASGVSLTPRPGGTRDARAQAAAVAAAATRKEVAARAATMPFLMPRVGPSDRYRG